MNSLITDERPRWSGLSIEARWRRL